MYVRQKRNKHLKQGTIAITPHFCPSTPNEKGCQQILIIFKS